jgi:streptogramin lyase
MSTRFNGASRYDDSRGWRHFKAGADRDSSLISNDFIFAALCDRNGDKWFGDWGGSIARLDDSGSVPNFTHYFINTNEDSVRYTLAWASAHDPMGSRWFGLDTTCRGCGPEFEPLGLSRIDETDYQNYNQSTGASMRGNQVRAVAFAPDGAMWVGYADLGVDVFANGNPNNRVTQIVAGPNGLFNNNVWSIVFQGSDAWILTDGSAVLLSRNGANTTRKDQIFLPTISNRGAVNPLAIDGEGGVWVGTARGVIHRSPDGSIEQFTASNSPLLDDDVHAIVIDRSNSDIWIGTALGVNRYRPGEVVTETETGVRPMRIYPNPIRYSVIGMQFTVRDADDEPMVRTDVRFYDASGRFLTQLRTDDTGNLSWRPEDRYGRLLQSGVYFMQALGFDEEGRRIATGKGRLVVTP